MSKKLQEKINLLEEQLFQIKEREHQLRSEAATLKHELVGTKQNAELAEKREARERAACTTVKAKLDLRTKERDSLAWWICQQSGFVLPKT